jgi:hypothetical protein
MLVLMERPESHSAALPAPALVQKPLGRLLRVLVAGSREPALWLLRVPVAGPRERPVRAQVPAYAVAGQAEAYVFETWFRPL